MPGNRTSRLSRLALLLVASSLAGCSLPPPGDEEPTPRQVRKELAQHLKGREEHVLLTDLHPEGEGRYTGTAESGPGITYSVKAETQGRWLRYTAQGRTLLGDGPFLSAIILLPIPSFRERHPELMQWLRAVACVTQGLAGGWALLGRFGYRRLFSPRVERLLVVSAAINLGFALVWGYEFFTNLGAG